MKGPWSTGKSGLNQGIWTTMSYNDGWNKIPSHYYEYGWQGTLMALDSAGGVNADGSPPRRLTGGIARAVWWLALAVAVLLPWPAAAEVQLNAVPPAATDAAIIGSDALHRVYFDPAAPRLFSCQDRWRYNAVTAFSGCMVIFNPMP